MYILKCCQRVVLLQQLAYGWYAIVCKPTPPESEKEVTIESAAQIVTERNESLLIYTACWHFLL